jgi:hypothetical protein
MLLALGFFGTVVPSAACVPQNPGVRQTTGTVVLVVELVEVLLLVDVLELVLVLELVEVLLLVDVLELVLVLELVEVLLLVDVEVDVDVEVVPQLFVHESPSLALPSSHASPELTCTIPSPQIVHGFSLSVSRHVCPLAGHPTCGGSGLSLPQMLGLPPTRIAGQHSSPTGTWFNGSVSQVSKAWLTIPSPQITGKNNTALPSPAPVVQSVGSTPGT